MRTFLSRFGRLSLTGAVVVAAAAGVAYEIGRAHV